MKAKKFLIPILISISFISVTAQNWEAFTNKYTYLNGKFERKKMLLSPPSSLVFAGNSWIVNSQQQPFIMAGDEKTPMPEPFTKGLKEMGYDPKDGLKILYSPSGMIYIHSNNFFAYKKINDPKWQGFSLDPKVKIKPTGSIPALEFSLITSSTINRNGDLIISGIKNDLPVIASLKNDEWDYLNIETLISSVPPKKDKHSKFNISLGGVGFGKGPDGYTLLNSEYVNNYLSVPLPYFVYNMVCDKDDNIWFLSDENLWCISPSGTKQVLTEKINSINISAKGDVYVSTETGVKKLVNNKLELVGSPWKVKTFYVDANDILWFVPEATIAEKETLDISNGIKAGFKEQMEKTKKAAETSFKNEYVRRYDAKNNLLFTLSPSNSPFSEEPVKYITSDPEGKKYFIGSSGIYILKEPALNDDIWSASYGFNKNDDDFLNEKWCASFQCNENESLCLAKDRIGFSKNGKVEYKNLTLIPNVKNMSNDGYNYFSAVAADKKGNIYVGTQLKGLFKYEEKGCTSLNMDEKMAGKKIKSLAMDKNDNLWIGTDKALVKYDGKTFTYFDKKNSQLENSDINALYVDDNNLLWIATDGGLYNYDGNNWNVFNKKNNSLKSDKIEALTGFKNKIYFTTSGELYSLENGNIKYENAQNNKALNNILKNGLFIAPSGNLWIVAKGTTIFCKESNGTLTEYNKNNSPVPAANVVEMAYMEGTINIHLRRHTTMETNTPPGDVFGKDSERFYTFDDQFILKVKTK